VANLTRRVLQGIEATRQLEAEGIQIHVSLVSRYCLAESLCRDDPYVRYMGLSGHCSLSDFYMSVVFGKPYC
jgi:hypothetical protein